MMVDADAMPSEPAYCDDHAATIATYMLTGHATDAGDETSQAKSVYQNMICYAQYRQVIKAAASAFRALDAKTHDGQDESKLIMRSVGAITDMVQASAAQVREEQPGYCDQVAAKQFSDLGYVGDQGVTTAEARAAAVDADMAANDARAAVEKDAQAKADADRARIEAEVKAKIEAERAQIEAEAKAKVRARIEADLRAKAEADATAKAEADAKADIAAAQQAKDKAAADAKAAAEARMEAEAVARHDDEVRKDKEAAETKAREDARMEAEAAAQNADNVRAANAAREASIRAEKEAAEVKASEEARIAAEAEAQHEANVREVKARAETEARQKAEEEARIAEEARVQHEANVRYTRAREEKAALKKKARMVLLKANAAKAENYQLAMNCNILPEWRSHPDRSTIEALEAACEVLKERGVSKKMVRGGSWRYSENPSDY